MKNFVLFFFLFFFISSITFAQGASDYYLPLKVGNYLQFSSVRTGDTRTISYSIEGTDVIDGNLHFIEVGTEVSSFNGDSSRFRVFWLRKDAPGNIILGAISEESLNLDSAMMINLVFLPNEYGTLGYSRSFSVGDETIHDTVVSISETVIVPAGTFTNCVKIRETGRNNIGNLTTIEDIYYAFGIGMVKFVKSYPVENAHIDELISYNIATSNNEENLTPSKFSLEQNYPNPFNPKTTIQFSIESKSFVSLKVFDLLGREVATLISEELTSGNHSVNWYATNMQSGVYFYEIRTDGFSETKKLVLLK